MKKISKNIKNNHISYLLTFKPNDDVGGLCEVLNPPYYVNNCHYDGAAHILNQVSIFFVQSFSNDKN